MDALTWLRTQWDRALGIALIVAGAVLLLLGWIGVSGSEYLAEELAYIVSGGLGGLFLLGVGCTLLIVATLGDEWRKLDRLEQLLVAAAAGPAATDGSAVVGALAEAGDTLSEHPTRARRTGRTATVGAAGAVVSAGVLAYAWHTASGTADVQEAIDAVAIGAASLTAQVVAVGAFVVPERRALSRRIADVLGPVAVRLQLNQRPTRQPLAATVAPVDDRVAVIDGLTLYHRPDCVMTRGQATKLVPVQEAALRRQPCQLCKAR